MAEEDTIYVTALVSDMPTAHVPSFKVPCSDCSEDVWISEKMEKYWSKYKVICTVCALEITSKGQHQIEIVPENITGIIKYLISRGIK